MTALGCKQAFIISAANRAFFPPKGRSEMSSLACSLGRGRTGHETGLRFTGVLSVPNPLQTLRSQGLGVVREKALGTRLTKNEGLLADDDYSGSSSRLAFLAFGLLTLA